MVDGTAAFTMADGMAAEVFTVVEDSTGVVEVSTAVEDSTAVVATDN